MTTKQQFSLNNNIRFRILKEMLANLKVKFPSVANFILVMDPTTTKIVSSSVKTVDLLEEGVLAMEKLELKRKEFPQTHAIYFVAPTKSSVEKIIADFSDPEEPQYGNVHLFFTTRVDPQLFSQLKKQRALVERVLTFKEINLDMMCSEANVFHLDMPEALPIIFSQQGQPQAKALEERIASSLSTVVPNLMDFDYFHIVANKNKKNQVSSRIAKMVEENIKKFISLKNASKDEDDDDDETPVPVKIVILDRTFDPLTPAVRDYYYESLVYEFLNIDGNIVTYEEENNKNEVEVKKAILNEKDELWEKYKNLFISEAMLSIANEFDQFARNNSNIQMANADPNSMDLSQMSEYLKQMPAYKELLEKYTLHMNLIEKISKIFAQKELKDIGDLEQCLATGFDAQGKQIGSQKLIAMIAQKLAQGKLDDDAKLRLMLIASFGLELNERERKSLTKSLPDHQKDILEKLSWLGLGEEKHPLLKGRISNKMKDMPNPVRDRLKNIPGNLCRHVPLIEAIAADMGSNFVDSKRFESLYVPEEYDGSLKPEKDKNQRIIKSKREEDPSRLPKLIIFIVGGITHSELRVLAEYGKQHPHLNVIIGSTAIMNVQDYINGISKMTSTGEHQVINIDDE